jgi:hypothetical protein
MGLIGDWLARQRADAAMQKLRDMLQPSTGAAPSPDAPPITPLPAPQPAPQGGSQIQGGNWVNDSASFFNPHIAALGQFQGAAPDPAAARAAAARDLVQAPAQVPTSGGTDVTTWTPTSGLYRTLEIARLAQQAGVPLNQLLPLMRAERYPGAYQGLEGHPVARANMANNKSVAYPWAMNSSGEWNRETGAGGWSPSMQSQVGVDRARTQVLGAQQQKLETQADFPAKVGGKTVRAYRDDNGQIRYRSGPDGKPLEWTAEPKTFAPGQRTKTPDNPDNFYWQRVADYQRQVYDPKKARAMADSDYQARYGHPYSPGAGQETAGVQPDGGTSQQTTLIEQAREAVKAGVPRSFVEQQLQEYGIDPGAL